jgi:glycosyltransferase involved in cell wall biosynthesis
MSQSPIRLLTFSTLFPSSVRPGHGIFIETRLRELLKSGRVDAQVVAPVPWFPSTHPRFGAYARMARTPRQEVRNGIAVHHPRYPLIPKLGMTMAPVLMAAASLGPIRRLLRAGFDFDVIDAHYFYPDGVAAALLGKWLGKPVVITARGTDLNLIAQYTLPRRMIRWAADRADAAIGVCAALTEVLRGLGISGDKLHVMRNGVDLERFRPLDQQAQRRKLNLGPGPVLLSVGNLIDIKGHHLTIEALPQIIETHPNVRLVIIGDGPERAALLQRAAELGVKSHVLLPGAIAQSDLASWYSAADAFVLASSREGWANVLLESMACGTPVVATHIGGTPEVVAGPVAGLLVRERSGPGLAAGILSLLDRQADRGAVRAYAEGFSWAATTQAQLELFDRLVTARRGAAHA